MAPEKLFADYHRWPTVLLCQKCHSAWHGMVTPNLHKVDPEKVFVSGKRELAVLSSDTLSNPSGLMIEMALEFREKPYLLSSGDHGIKPPASKHCVRCWEQGALLHVTFGPAGQGWPSHHLCARCALVYQRQMLLAAHPMRESHAHTA